MTDTADEQRPGPLMREALDLFGEYQHTGGRPLITRAVPAFRTALAAADRYGVPDIAAYYNNLAYALHELAEATGDRAAQAESADWHRAAVAATERDDPDLAGYLCTLASGLCAQFGYTGQAELLREALAAATEAVGLPGAEPGPAIRYAVLAGVLGKLYEREADPAVLTELIAAYQQAAGHAELAGDPAVAAHWNSLGAWLSELYECTGDTGALSDASRADRTRRSRDYRCFPRGNRIARCYAPAAGSLPALADVPGRAYPHRAVTSRGSACGRGGDTRPGG